MADIFYQGEDITLNIELFEDDGITPISFTSKDVTILAYTEKESGNIILSTKENTITRNSEFHLTGLIPSEKTKVFNGALHIEMLIESNTSKHISISSDITILPCKVGLL